MVAKISPAVASQLLLILNLNCLLQAEATTNETTKDLRWPARRVNVLVDGRSLNASERQVVLDLLDQLEHRTCLRLERLYGFPRDHSENFIYIFKVHQPQQSTQSAHSIGLSNLGCLHQGRQSIILTDHALRWPRPLLTYHLLRSLGLANLTRPDLSSLAGQLNGGQRILNMAELANSEPYFVYSSQSQKPPKSREEELKTRQVRPAEYLSEQELAQVKELYNCSEYQSRLSLPRHNDNQVEPKSEQSDEWPSEPAGAFEKSSDEAGQKACQPLESCPLETNKQPRSPRLGDHSSQEDDGRPMILKLDPFHAHDPQLKQANQMKLSVLPGGGGDAAAESFRLLEAPAERLSPAFNSKKHKNKQETTGASQEMLISFEQTATNASSPLAALASSQVLKLCSCTCQTMAPASSPSTNPTTRRPATTSDEEPVPSTSNQEEETTRRWGDETTTTSTPTWTSGGDTPSGTQWPPTSVITDEPSWPPVTTQPPPPQTQTFGPPTTEEPPVTTTGSPAWTQEPATTTTTMTTTEQPTISPTKSTRSERPTEATTSFGGDITTNSNVNSGYCDQVEWVRPNKTLYKSARIVWDVDRANQNYFLCQNQVGGDALIPGKTHGLSCQVSSEGKAYELHNFLVLTKPESVSLAWVQRNNPAFGTTNLPVIGGHSAGPAGDPYVVARCLVRDENNDVLTLIGYVNARGQAWFPFDDIQIECSQYDVLACVA